jgi:protein-disulfide isomerase
MPRYARLLAAALVLAGTVAARAATADFTPEQRAAIVAIMRDALAHDPTILRDAISALQHDEGIRQQAALHDTIAHLSAALRHTAGDPVAGNPNGTVTVVEFYDLHCPYCRQMLPVTEELLKRHPEVRLVFKDIPILGPGSMLGARAVLAAQRQGGYMKLQDALMTGPASIDEASVRAAAEHVGLDWGRLAKDMADPAIKARIDANLALAARLDIDGTPAYIVGDQMLPGAIRLSDFESALAAAK